MSVYLAVVDDDQIFADTLARRLGRKGYEAHSFYDVNTLLASSLVFGCLVLDMNLGRHSILTELSAIRAQWPNSRIIILTGYASIATTVSAIKLGADDYITKPVDIDLLLAALKEQSVATEAVGKTSVISSQQLEWEHIQRVLLEHGGNVSATARALNMHRRTLQRKLQKKQKW